MSNTNSPWIWSETYQDHYYVTHDQYGRCLCLVVNGFCERPLIEEGNPVYNWSRPRNRNDSIIHYENAMPEPGMTRKAENGVDGA